MRTLHVRLPLILGILTLPFVLTVCGGDGVTDPIPTVETLEVTPGQARLVSIGETVELGARATDSEGRVVGDVAVTWSSSDESVATVSGAGVVTAVANGTTTITARTDGASGSTSITVDQEVAAVTLDLEADTLTAFGDTRTLEAVATDAGGTPVAGASLTWTSSDPSVVTVGGDGTVEAVGNGMADVTAAAGGVSASLSLAVIQMVAEVSVSPASAALTTVGATQQFSATAVDANGNPVDDARILWQSSDQAVAVVDTLGHATSRGAGAATISAAVEGVPGYATLTVEQAVAGLVFVVDPSSAGAGEAMDPAVQVEVVDGAGNRVADASLAITLTLTGGASALLGTTTVNAVDGVATFSGLSVHDAAEDYKLQATAAGLAAATSGSFSITPGAAAALGFRTGPSSTEAGSTIAPAVEVRVTDAFGNTVSDATPSITVTLAANPAGAALDGTLAAAAVSGVAAFDDLTLTKAAEGYTLQATAPDLDPATSQSFAITAAAAAALRITSLPDTVEGRVPFTVQVAVEDVYGNVVSGASDPVSLALTSSPRGDALDGTLSTTPTEGVATFDDLVLALPAEGYALEATTAGLPADASEPFSVGLTFADVSGHIALHSCGLTTAGFAYCWGFNNYGPVGDGSTTAAPLPVPVQTSLRFSSITVGTRHTCALTSTGAAYCWGRNDFGQLGDATTTERTTPVAVAGGSTFTEIEAGGLHTCGLDASGAALCWGRGSFGQLGNGDVVNESTPTTVLGGRTFEGLAVGSFHSCALEAAGTAFCWGLNDDGQLGNNSTLGAAAPVQVATGVSYTDLAAGSYHTCAVGEFGSAQCWGANSRGQLGDGTTAQDSTPRTVTGDVVFRSIAPGETHTCALTPLDHAYCWGNGTSGRLGNGADQISLVPVSVDGGLELSHISTGEAHSCAVTPLGRAFCWGSNAFSQLGNDVYSASSVPIPVEQ